MKGADKTEAGNILAKSIVAMMKVSGIPNGLKGVGCTEKDIKDLTDGTFPQKRLIENAPLPIGRSQLEDMFKMCYCIGKSKIL